MVTSVKLLSDSNLGNRIKCLQIINKFGVETVFDIERDKQSKIQLRHHFDAIRSALISRRIIHRLLSTAINTSIYITARIDNFAFHDIPQHV